MSMAVATQEVEAMETIKEDYRGYEISYVNPPLMGNTFQVNVASENPRLLARLGSDDTVVSGRNMADAIAKAKLRIDAILGG